MIQGGLLSGKRGGCLICGHYNLKSQGNVSHWLLKTGGCLIQVGQMGRFYCSYYKVANCNG